MNEIKQHELTFDIDIDLYDDVRMCCSGPKICIKCWKFLAIAVKVVHRTLTGECCNYIVLL